MQADRKIVSMLLPVFGIFTALVFFYNTNRHEKTTNERRLSEMNGYLAWQSEQRLYPLNDVEAYIKGVRDCASGKNPPNNMTFKEMYDLAQEVEFQAHRKQMQENLQESEVFLADIAQRPGIVVVVDKLVYYERLAEGVGENLVEPSSTCYFHYSVSLPDGAMLYSTHEEGEPQSVCLDCVVSGFAQGVVGMKKGEKRRLYIHPQQAFRTMHWTVPPNMALVFDVELVDLQL